MSQVQAFSRRLRLPKAVEEKAKEYHRLSEVKCSSAMKSEPCLTLVCIEIACGKLGEPIDKMRQKLIQRLSGMQPKAYSSSYQMVEKVLNLVTQVSVKDLAVRFGCLEAKELAKELMSRYKGHIESKYTASQKEALDLGKPLYAAAALYCACKLLKIRCDKNNYLAAALSSRAVFQNVLDEITQCAPKNIDDFKSRKRSHGNEPAIGNDYTSSQAGPSSSTLKSSRLKVSMRDSFDCRMQSNPTAVIYLKWRETILKEAKKELEEQTV